MTCDICGTGYISKEDILIYGCYMCGEGRKENMKRTFNLKVVQSEYCSAKLRRTLYIKHDIPLECAQSALEGTKSVKNYLLR